MSLIEKNSSSFGQRSYSGAPFIVYRSAKYVGIRERAFHYLTTFGRFYILSPISDRIRRILNPIQEIIAFLFVIVASPFFLISFIGLFFLRKLRIYLIRKYYPNLLICEDLSPRRFLNDKPDEMVTSVVWVKGHIEVSSLRSHLESRILSGNLQILSQSLGSRMTLKIWDQSYPPFDIQKHVIQAPGKFYDCLITDDTRDLHGLGGKSDKSVLEKYVTSRASVELDEKLPPWQITLVSLPLSTRSSICSNNRNSRTCVVLRFHKLLLQRTEVVKMLVNSLGQSGGMEVVDAATAVQWISSIPQLPEDKTDERSLACVKEIRVPKPMFVASIMNEYKSTTSELISWYRLRRKQYEFHTKLDFTKCLWLELIKPLKSVLEISNLKIWTDLKSRVLQCFKVLRAISFILLVSFQSFVSRNNPNGFRRSEKRTTRHVSWSKPISVDFLKEIQKKAENASEESVLLMACSLALRDYYYENCISNPKYIGVTVSSSSSSPDPEVGKKLLDLTTNFRDISAEINKTNVELKFFPEWKQLGLSYLEDWLSRFLPRPLTFLVTQKIFKRYPINFNYLDTESPFPHLSLWGQTIDEFTFWRSTHSDFGVSISVVKYAGSLRLSVLSPMKCVDCIISQRFSQYLNKIAESVGVQKSRIPYSRKSSPNSTAASSPDQKRSHLSFFKSNSLPEN